MSATRPMKMLFAFVLIAATIAVGTLLDGRPAAGAGSQAPGVSADRGAVPPILQRATPSERAAIASAQSEKAAARSYRVPRTARYSDAEMRAR
jgi:hypothetical protein